MVGLAIDNKKKSYDWRSPVIVGFMEGGLFGAWNRFQNKAMVNEKIATGNRWTHIKSVVLGPSGSVRHLLNGTPVYILTKVMARGVKWNWTYQSHAAVKDLPRLNHVPEPVVFGGLGAIGGALEAFTVAGPEYVKNKQQFADGKAESAWRIVGSLVKENGGVKGAVRVSYTAVIVKAKRNMIGSGTLFSTKAIIMEYMGAEDYRRPTFFQSIVSAGGAASATIIVSHPWDMLAHRKIKAQQMGQEMPKMNIAKFLSLVVQNEGWRSVAKGVPQKLTGSGLKLAGVTAAVDGVTHWLLANNEKNEPKTSPPSLSC